MPASVQRSAQRRRGLAAQPRRRAGGEAEPQVDRRRRRDRSPRRKIHVSKPVISMCIFV